MARLKTTVLFFTACHYERVQAKGGTKAANIHAQLQAIAGIDEEWRNGFYIIHGPARGSIKMTDRALPVPYLVQPTSITCQSTCLKMFGLFLANRVGISSPVQSMAIPDIWKEINEGHDRPSKEQNSYSNMAWWLHKQFPMYKFAVESTKSVDEAMMKIVKMIDNGFPVIVSTNHSRTAGHIILVIGYKGAQKLECSEISFVCHDPYGKFNPSLHSRLYSKRRFEGGSSQRDGGENGPGKGVIYDSNGIRRIRKDKHSSGTYFLLSVAN